jgi:hypothetical protein
MGQKNMTKIPPISSLKPPSGDNIHNFQALAAAALILSLLAQEAPNSERQSPGKG